MANYLIKDGNFIDSIVIDGADELRQSIINRLSMIRNEYLYENNQEKFVDWIGVLQSQYSRVSINNQITNVLNTIFLIEKILAIFLRLNGESLEVSISVKVINGETINITETI